MEAARKFDTTNAEHLKYQYDVIEITILGGIRLEGLDRLRVTLKIQIEHLSIRHNLDLYNDTQTEKLIRKAAERLEIGTSVMAACLMDLTDVLEQYRLEEIEKQSSNHDRRKMLSPDEIKEAQGYLKAPNLMGRTSEDIGQAGVIGEETNRHFMFMIFLSRKRETPLHIISLGSSGIGKTHLQEKVSALVPEEDKIEITTLSENAFYYFGQRQLQNKLILIEDLDGAEGVLYPLRELQSKRKINKTVVHKNTKGETRSVNLTVEGPVCVSGCTTRESLYEDNANRSFLIYIDESPEQDERIMDYQRKLAAGKIDLSEQWKIIEQFQNIQRVLQPVQIRNPYAEQLKIPKEVFKPRRTNAHYLAFIEVVTFYHQYQRERKYDKTACPNSKGGRGEEYIETTLEDIAEANKLLKEVLLRKSDMLTGACRNYFEGLKNHLRSEEKTSFTNKEIRQILRTKATTLKRYHGQLLEAGLIRVKAGKRYKGYEYEIVNQEEYQQLRNDIGSVLDEIMNQIEQSSVPLVAHQSNGQAKRKKAS